MVEGAQLLTPDGFQVPVGSGWERLLVEHFLLKSTCRVSASGALLASVLCKTGWSVLITWKVRLLVNLPLMA